MHCRDIHFERTGCQQEIPSNHGWKYCPRCGRATGHLLNPAEGDRIFMPAAATTATNSTLPLRGHGEMPVRIEVSIENRIETLEVLRGLGRGQASDRYTHDIDLRIGPLNERSELGLMIIKAYDRPLDTDGDPWQQRLPRELRLPLIATVSPPLDVKLVPALGIFRSDVSERTFLLCNYGESAANVINVECPPGYEASSVAGEVPGKTHFTIGELEIKVKRNWSQPTNNVFSTLKVVLAAVGTLETTLYCPPPSSPRQLDQAIVSIDFGMAFTSIAFRNCRNLINVDDEVVLLTPEGEANTGRFPAQLWLGKNRDVHFGLHAAEMLSQAPNDGFLFREIKALLHDPDSLLTPPANTINPTTQQEKPISAAAIALAREIYGDNWPEQLVMEYLRWLYRSVIEPRLRLLFQRSDVGVRYVFSLPMLGYATDWYELQRSTMKQCIQQAGFPMDRVEFQLEPVCAMFGLLHPRPDWPRLGSREYPLMEGDAIVVINSDDSNTNVVLATVHVAPETQRLSLQVEHNFGLDGDAGKIGGETIATEVSVERIRSLAEELQEHLFEFRSPAQVRYYLCVGNNPALPQIEKWVEQFMQDTAPEYNGRRLRIPEHDRGLAVAYGAVWVPTARIRNVLMYDLQVVVDGASIFSVDRNTSQEIYGRHVQLDMAGGMTMIFELVATVSGMSYTVATARVHNPYDHEVRLYTWMAIQMGALTIDYTLQADSAPQPPERQTLLSYSL